MPRIVTGAGIRERHVVFPFTESSSSDQVGGITFDNGVSWLDLRADSEMEDLLDARFSDPVPVVWASGTGIHIEYPLGSRLLRRTDGNTVRVNPRVPWSVDVHGGADHLTADLTGIDVRSVATHAGTAHTQLHLGNPTGTCVIRLASVTDMRIRRPPGVPLRAEVAKGATNITVDNRWFGAVGGGLIEQTTGYDDTEARYLVIVSGGANTLTIETAGPDADRTLHHGGR